MPDVDVGAVVHNVSLECEEIRKSGQPYFAVLERREVDAEGLESVGCDGRHVSGTQVLEILVTGQAELLQALKSFRRKRPLAEQVPAVPPRPITENFYRGALPPRLLSDQKDHQRIHTSEPPSAHVHPSEFEFDLKNHVRAPGFHDTVLDKSAYSVEDHVRGGRAGLHPEEDGPLCP